MSLFGFGKRSRRRSRTRRSRSRRSRSRRSRSRRRSRRSRGRKGSFERVGNKIHIVGRKGKKILKIKKNKDGREYYISGKRKTKHFLDKVSKRRTRRRSRSGRRFGYMKNTLLDFMGNYQPAQMSLAQSTTGMSAPQMIAHMNRIPLSVRSNFYTNIV